MHQPYYSKIAAAYVRGRLKPTGISNPLFEKDIDELTADELEELIQLGIRSGLKLHRFKQTMSLARVRKVLGILKGIQPATLLDIGSGRGVFLWPLLHTFPGLSITALDLLDYRVNDIQAVSKGGFANLHALLSDTRAMGLRSGIFDVVTALEVLEHVPNAPDAIREIARVAREYVVISAPSREDDNPEHIHLFNTQRMKELFASQNVGRLKFDFVLNHMIVVARKGNDPTL